MVDNISARQNFPEQLNCLAAQRTLYSKAKLFTHVQIFLSVPIMIVISLIVLALNNHIVSNKIGIKPIDISWVAAAFGVGIAIFDTLIVTPIIEQYKEKAAKIQELFDVAVFNLPWNNEAVGNKPDHEDINKYANKLKKDKKEFNKLVDWYSGKLSGIPHNIAVIICQRSNLWWDVELRSRFSKIAAIVAVLIIILLFFIGLLDDLTIKKFFLLVLSPALPIIIFSARQYLDNRKAIKRLNELKDLLNTSWDEIINKKISDDRIFSRARRMQDQIYINRSNNPLILDWYYELEKSRQHENMYYSIDQMIGEYRISTTS